MAHSTRSVRCVWVLLLVLALQVDLSFQENDPINNFCRRWGHQSAVMDDKLFFDGGVLTYRDDTSHNNVSNPYLIYHDLSTKSSSGMPPPSNNASKNSTIPSVNGGIFWPDEVNKRLYLYGGEVYSGEPQSFSLYSYDVLNNYWDVHPVSDKKIVSLSYGAGVAISSRGEGYYYGGWMNSKNNANWKGSPVATSNLLLYQMDTNTWENKTGPDTIGRAEGVMLHVPASDGGLLVYFGGVRDKGKGKWEAQPMDEIIIYDILSGKSYTQNATGDVPQERRKFCAGISWVDDQSSYNIYLYGGGSQEDGGLGFDDVYVLSLPSFTWIKMYPEKSINGDSPHHSMTCNVVKRGQMIVHGGFFPENDECDSEKQWGIHNMDMTEQNSNKALWELYDPSRTTYVLPEPIKSVVGGQTTGGATKTEPDDGWSHSDLAVLMTRKATVEATRTPTRNVQGPTSTNQSDESSGKGLSTGAIAGIAIGSVVGVAMLGVIGWYLARRRGLGSSGKTRTTDSFSSQHQMGHFAHDDYAHKDTMASPGVWSPNTGYSHPSDTSTMHGVPPYYGAPHPAQQAQPYGYADFPAELATEPVVIANAQELPATGSK